MAKKILLILSLAVEACLLAEVNLWSILFFGMILLMLSAGLLKRESLSGKTTLKIWERVFVILLQTVITVYATIHWGEAITGMDDGAALLKHIIRNEPWILAVVIVAGVIGSFFLRFLISSMLKTEANGSVESFSTKQRWIWCFFCALIPVTICSENSFLYPLNDWLDVSCFFTVGRSWMHGMIPYRDLIEQKGPCLYLLYGIASLFSAREYIGAWVLEVLSGTVYLYYAGKTAALYMGQDKKKEILLIPLFSVLTYASKAFYPGGSTEEFCLPLLMYATYIGLKALKEQKQIGTRESIVNGLFIALILWSKFTILGYYIGWVLFFGIHTFRQYGIKSVGKLIGGLLTGFLLVTVPVLIYFGFNHALKDLFEIYFYDNIFLYPHLNEEGSTLKTLLLHYANGASLLVMTNRTTVVLAILFLIFRKNKRKEIGLLLSCAAVLFLTSFIGKWSWGFYTLVFTPLAAAGLGTLFAGLQGKVKVRFRYVLAVFILFFSVLLTPNAGFLQTKKEDTVQYQFASIINQKEDATLLVYGCLDRGFYQAADLLPVCKAFCGLASPIPEVSQLQQESIEQGLTDFVVSRVSLESPLYEEVMVMDGYRLYQHQ